VHRASDRVKSILLQLISSDNGFTKVDAEQRPAGGGRGRARPASVPAKVPGGQQEEE
jgi:hypothetical protein